MSHSRAVIRVFFSFLFFRFTRGETLIARVSAERVIYSSRSQELATVPLSRVVRARLARFSRVPGDYDGDIAK